MKESSTRWRSRLTSAADFATIVCGVVAVTLFVLGSFRTALGNIGVSISGAHAAFVAAALAAIRHTAIPSPSILVNIHAWSANILRRPALADAVVAFWATRPAVLVIGFFAVVTIGLPDGAPRVPSVINPPLRSLPARWDAQWYAGIAAHGYEWQYRFDLQQNLAFFPAYPALVRLVGITVGAFRSTLPEERQIVILTWCGVFVALVAFFWASWYFAQLAREVLDESRARHAVLLLATYPFALFFSAAYTESLFLLAALATWYHFRRGDTALAFGWGVLAGLARPNGLLLSVPLALIAAGTRDAGWTIGADRRRRFIVAAAPVFGMLLFTVYLHHVTGIWFAWSRMHGAWGRAFGSTSGMSALADAIGRGSLIEIAASHPYDVLNSIGMLFALGLARAVWRHVGPGWGVFVVINVLAPLLSGGLLSMGRVTSTLFPLFLALAAVLPPRGLVPVMATGAALQGLFAALFFTWRDLY